MSQIIATTLSNGTVSVPTATVVNGSAKAWVNFNGTGTIAARDSFNVASLTDLGVGEYNVNLTAAMATGNNAATALSSRDASASQVGMFQGNILDATFFRLTELAGGTFFDVNIVTASLQGDLA